MEHRARIGVFFDGTGNNKWNDALIDDGSLSNVAKLHTLYLKSGHIALYAQGVGTEEYTQEHPFTQSQIDSIRKGKERSAYYKKAGLALGHGSREIVDKKLEEIDEVIAQNSDKEIIVDVFGFSRGAAEARDFINKCKEKYADTPLKDSFGFVGLFDTVASMGLAGDHNFGYTLDLNEGSAQTIVHITSKDERRKNFPLESLFIKKGFGLKTNMQEIRGMGVHADIGGGYGEFDLTKKIVVKEFDEIFYDDKKRKAVSARISALQKQAETKGYLLEYEHEIRPPSLNDWQLKAVFIENRTFQYGLSNVYLNLMYKKIKASGIELVDITVLGETKTGYSNFLEPSSYDKSYVHVSASDYWPGHSLGDWLAHREARSGKRKIYYNNPENAV